jgi:hypothetical protein
VQAVGVPATTAFAIETVLAVWAFGAVAFAASVAADFPFEAGVHVAAAAESVIRARVDATDDATLLVAGATRYAFRIVWEHSIVDGVKTEVLWRLTRFANRLAFALQPGILDEGHTIVAARIRRQVGRSRSFRRRRGVGFLGLLPAFALALALALATLLVPGLGAAGAQHERREQTFRDKPTRGKPVVHRLDEVVEPLIVHLTSSGCDVPRCTDRLWYDWQEAPRQPKRAQRVCQFGETMGEPRPIHRLMQPDALPMIAIARRGFLAQAQTIRCATASHVLPQQ